MLIWLAINIAFVVLRLRAARDPETLEFGKEWADRSDMLASHDGPLSAGGASSSAKRVSESSHAPMVAGSWI